MLQIRKEQMEVLEAYALQQFETKVFGSIARLFPEKLEQVGREKTELLIKAGILKASRYGIKSRKDIEQFICLMFDRGHDFETGREMSWCRNILEDRQLPGDAKVKLIYHELEVRGNTRASPK